MTSQESKRVIQIERLEDRQLLANTADIILILDESASIIRGAGGRLLLNFVADDFLPTLEAELRANGIGSDQNPNRYGMVAYGSGQRHDNPFHNIDVVLNGNINPPPWPVEIHPNADNPYLVPISSDPEPEEASLDDLTGMIRDWPDYNWNASEHEDSWLAVDFVFNAHFNNQPDEDDPEETLIYKFRPSAAVHFILITDRGRPRGDEGKPALPMDVFDPENPQCEYFEDWPGLKTDVNLDTLLRDLGRSAGQSDDIVLTALAPARFDPDPDEFDPDPDDSDPEELIRHILGIDVNVMDGVDVDRDIDVAPEITDDYVVFYVDDVDGNGVIDPDEGVVDSQHFVGNLLGDPSAEAGQNGYEAPETQKDLYPRIKDELSYEGKAPWLWDANPFGPSPIFNFTGLIDQKQIDLAIGVDPPPEGVEEQVFLAWETGGTVWTSKYFNIEGIGPTEVPGLPDLLSDAMAKDIANKMKDPRVTGVTIGSGQLPSGEVDSYDVPGGSGEQLRTVPVRKADRITIRFSEEVDVTADDLTLESALEDGPEPGPVQEFLPVMDRSTNTYTATWVFTEFEANQIELTLSENVTDLMGHMLDGDWTNPTTIACQGTSVFPSGTGTYGMDFVFRFTILPGDLNRNNIVGGADFDILVGNHGTAGSFEDGDLDGDGYVTADDVTDYDYIILSGYYAKVWIIWGYDFVLGDTDGDGDVDAADVDEFIALVCASQYTILGDMNEDGAVDGLDVEYFADMLLYHAPQF